MSIIAADLFLKAGLRHARFYLQQVEVAHQAHHNQQTPLALVLFDEHWSQINEAFQRLQSDDNLEFVCIRHDFVRYGIDLLTMRRPVHEQVVWLTQGLDAARTLADQQSEMGFLVRLGQAYLVSKSNDLSAQYYEQALELAQSVRDAGHEADALVGLGRIKSLSPKTADAARNDFLAAINLYRALDNRRGLGWSLLNLGGLEDRFGDLQVAQAYLNEAIALYEEIGDQRSLATALRRLANILDRGGNTSMALVQLQKALDIGRSLDDIELVPACLLTMGLIKDNEGDRTAAHRLFEEALFYTYRSGNKQLMGTALINLGWIAVQLGDFQAAALYQQQSLDLYRSLNYPTRVAASLTNLGFVQLHLGTHEAAEGNLREAFVMIQEVGTIQDSLDVLIGFAWLDLLRGRAERGAHIIGVVHANPPETMYAERRAFLSMVQPDLEAAFPPDALERALAEGATLVPEAVIGWFLPSSPHG